MKRSVFILVGLFAIVVINAQTESMKFSGIPMNQKYSSFIQALKQKGFNDNVKQGEWRFAPGYNFITLAGKFWHFDNCEIRVMYSAETDSIASVGVRKMFFSTWHNKVFELMSNLDLKYGERIKLKESAKESKYRWFSKESLGMVEVNWFMNSLTDQFWVIYYTSDYTKKVLQKELNAKLSELEDL